MNKNKISLGSIFVGIISISFVLYMCLTFKPVEKKINNLFQVYLGGKKIGIIKSQEESKFIIARPIAFSSGSKLLSGNT